MACSNPDSEKSRAPVNEPASKPAELVLPLEEKSTGPRLRPLSRVPWVVFLKPVGRPRESNWVARIIKRPSVSLNVGYIPANYFKHIMPVNRSKLIIENTIAAKTADPIIAFRQTSISSHSL